MPTNSELKARLEHLGPTRVVARVPLSSEESLTLLLRRIGKLDKPVSVARRLVDAGASMRASHATISHLAETGWAVCTVSRQRDPVGLARDLADMNVQARRRTVVADEVVDIGALRVRHGLSQREYADLLGLDVRTLQNWEQGRNRPDPAALSLMRLFDRAPEVFEEVMSEPIA